MALRVRWRIAGGATGVVREPRPPQWPLPVQPPWWRGDYADIRERILRHGNLDIIEELATAASDDGWRAFYTRHGQTEFYDDQAAAQRRRESYQRTKAKRHSATLAQREQALALAAAAQAAREAQALAAAQAAAEAAQKAAAAQALWQTAQQARREPSADLLTLLAMPQEHLQEHHKIAVAEQLEALFAARGAGPLRVASGQENVVSALSSRALALAKYDWYRENLDTLGKFYPPPLR